VLYIALLDKGGKSISAYYKLTKCNAQHTDLCGNDCAQCTLLFAVAIASRWDTSMLQSSPRVPDNITVEYLVEQKKIEQLDWGCLFNYDKPGHSKNKWHAIDTNQSENLKNPDFFRGTTFWINEYLVCRDCSKAMSYIMWPTDESRSHYTTARSEY
jgi:hypothetical protein